MRRKDIDLIKETLETFKVPPQTAQQIIDAVTVRYREEMSRELERQRVARAQTRNSWADTEEAIRIRNLNPGEYFIVPVDKRKIFRLAKNALMRLGNYGVFTCKHVKGVGDIIIRKQ